MANNLGKYGIIYMNYLKEYKKGMYKNLKDNGKLLDHCYEREQELKGLYETIEIQLRKQHPKPNTNSFIDVAQYEHYIEDTVNELVLDNIKF